MCRSTRKTATIPANDNCATPTKVLLNQSCIKSQIFGATKSTVRPTCVVYNSTDLWYTFTTATETNISLLIESGFTFTWALYTGTCSNLIEKTALQVLIHARVQ